MRRNPGVRSFTIPFLVASLAVGSGCRTPPVPVYREGLDRERYLRANLRLWDGALRPASLLSSEETLAAGTPVRIVLYSEREIRILAAGRELSMTPIGAETFPAEAARMDLFLEKYFAESPEGAAVEGLGPPEYDEAVRAGKPAVGMTKEQVYACLGPPYKIDGENFAAYASRRQILASDRWSYPNRWILVMPDLVELHFGDGRLQRISS
ncbi:MAG: hypothetical protein ACUVYA_10905 [Planctomycetota bacterium]